MTYAMEQRTAEDTVTKLLSLWRRALHHDEIAATDDFFALGGTSLAGVELLGDVRESFGVEVPPLAMYDEASTPAGMAAVIEAALGSRNGSGGDAHD